MAIISRTSDELELNRFEYRGAIRASELTDHFAFILSDPKKFVRDAINIVRPDADFSDLSPDLLDAMYDRQARAFANVELHLLRRAAWVMQGERDVANVDFWVAKFSRRPQASAMRIFPTFEDAAEWLMLPRDAVSDLDSGRGFRDIVSPATALV